MSRIGQLTEGEIEQELQNRGLDKGFRLTPQDVDKAIVGEHYWQVPGDAMMVCALTLQNGYTVIGKAACVEPANFDAEIGKKIAFDDARNQIWALEGYSLATMRMALKRMQDEIEAKNSVNNAGGA